MIRSTPLTSHDGVSLTVQNIAHALLERRWWLATAESCTGGQVAAACTDLAGSSQWFERGLVTYSNAAKMELLGVPATLLHTHGAVSEPVARAMALGTVQRVGVYTSLAVTGIAGPSGGSTGKPVGTVWFAWAIAGRVHSEVCRFAGDRAAVRASATAHALTRLHELLLTAPTQPAPIISA